MSSPCNDTRNWITATLADVTFVDDACFSFEADNPVSLVNSATMLLQIVDETCEAHGLLVNMNDGKAEFLDRNDGRRSSQAVQTSRKEDTKAHCISTKTGKRDDAETKANNALTAYHQLAHSVFRNSRISLHLCWDSVFDPALARSMMEYCPKLFMR